jgi:hypothetical protein
MIVALISIKGKEKKLGIVITKINVKKLEDTKKIIRKDRKTYNYDFN